MSIYNPTTSMGKRVSTTDNKILGTRVPGMPGSRVVPGPGPGYARVPCRPGVYPASGPAHLGLVTEVLLRLLKQCFRFVYLGFLMVFGLTGNRRFWGRGRRDPKH
jgi:hypothetical protein